MKNRLRASCTAVTALAVAGACLGGTVHGAGAADADPGRCGVSVSSNPVGTGETQLGFMTYLVRNQCTQGANFRVYQYTLGRNAKSSQGGGDCLYIPAGGTGTFWDPVGDRTWQAAAC